MTSGKAKPPPAISQPAERARLSHGARESPAADRSVQRIDLLYDAAGNLAVQQLYRAGVIHAKLAIVQPNDPDEEEADRIAEQVVSSGASATVHRKCDNCGSAACAGCEEEEGAIHRKTDRDGVVAARGIRAQIESVRGGGEPMPPVARSFFEARFGHDLSAVRVHADARAAESAKAIHAKAFTIGHDVVFGWNEYAPDSVEGRRLLAHELVHVVQHGGAAAIRRQSVKAPPKRSADSEKRVQDAISPGKPDLVAALSPEDVAQATTQERIKMIDILLTSGTFFQKDRIPKLWDSFGKGIVGMVNATPEMWRRSWSEAPDHMRNSYEVMGQETYFLTDVQDVASGYLDQNDQFCKDEAARFGLGENGEVLTGPPTLEQTKLLASTRGAASKIAAVQEAMRDLRKIKVGYQVRSLPPGGTEPLELGGPTNFDPDKPPNFPVPDNEPNRTTWEQVKKNYDDLDMLLQARLQANPGLFPLVRGAKEDPAKTGTVARGTPDQALSTIGAGLKETRENIAKTRPLLKTVAPDLEPIHGQLLSGRASVGGRNWKTMPFYEAIGRDLVDRRKPGPWWQELGLLAAQMGVYVIAGLATGGTALAIGLAVKGAVDVAMGAARSDVLESASKTNVSAETALVTEGQVDEAKGELIMTAAFALIDIATGAGAVRGALRSVRMFEQEAAKAAARASAAADKFIAKHSTEGAALALEANQAAVEARAAANKATSAAAGASKEEVARAAESSRQALSAAEAAEAKAAEIKFLSTSPKGDLAEIEQNMAKLRPSQVEGYAAEIPLGNNKFWRKTPDGFWCKFASPPRCLIPPDRVPVSVPTPTGGAAAELQRIAAGGYQKLPNGFKALDAVSGAMETISEGKRVLTQYTRPKGISIKYTGITDAAKLRSKVKGDLRALFEFTDYTLEGVRVKGLSSRELQLIFEEGLVNDLNKQSLAALAEMVKEAKTMQIKFEWFVYSGGRKLPGPKFFADQAKMLEGLE